jgi:hypothetical protein
MAYAEGRFKQHYKAAVEIRLGVDAAKNSPNLTSDGEAWKLYESTRTAPLGLQVFGRHKTNASQLAGEPGIELHGQVFPKIAKKRFFGMWKGRESAKERDARVTKAGFQPQLVHPTHQRDVSPVEFNFGITSDRSSGSILMMGQSWNLTINDAWLLGGVHSHQPFYLAFRKSYKNLFTDSYKHNLTITGRELLGLLLSGYKLEAGGELGDVMVCKNPGKADKMTLVKYATAAQQYEGPLKGKDMLVNFYNDPKTRDQIPKDLLGEVEQAIKDTNDIRGKFVAIARGAKFNLEV